jgi:hypothetical protein
VIGSRQGQVGKWCAVGILCVLGLLTMYGIGHGQTAGQEWFTVRVAARCKGEASFAVGACACTVKNRLEAGWGEGRVLEHYYAPDGKVNGEDVALVGKVLSGELACPGDYYFMFSTQDKRHLGLGEHGLAGVVWDGRGKRAVWFYAREALRMR